MTTPTSLNPKAGGGSIMGVLDPLVIPGVGPRGVIPVSLMQAPLRVAIPKWLEPAPGELPHILKIVWVINGKETSWSETFTAPPPAIPDPIVRFIPLATLREQSGTGEIYYSVETEAGVTEMDSRLQIRVDMVGPTLLSPQDRAMFVVAPPSNVVDEAYIAANAPVLIRLAQYNGREAWDRGELYLSNSPIGPASAPDAMQVFTLTSDPLIVSLDGAQLRRLLNGPAYVYYRLFDEAGNFSSLSAGLAFQLALNAPPTGLQLPEIAPPSYDDLLINRDDARRGVSVRIRAYSWLSGDTVEVFWNGRPIPRQPVVSFPFDVAVPWPILRGPAALLVAHLVPVRYEITRGQQTPIRSGVASFNVNLGIPGQENPNAPELVNPLLARVQILGQVPSTLNVIDNRHRGQDVLAQVALFDDPTPGEVLRLFCNGVGPVATYTVKVGDVTGQIISFSNLPWSLFEGIVNARLPFDYTIDNGVNQQRSVITEVNVNAAPAITLPAPKIQHSLTNGYATCTSKPSILVGVSWLVAPDAKLQLNDEIRFVWQGFTSNNWVGPIAGTEFNQSVFWSTLHMSQGWTVVVTSFQTTLFPLRKYGSATGSYEVWRNGVKVGDSLVGRVRVDLTYAGSGGYCGPSGIVLP